MFYTSDRPMATCKAIFAILIFMLFMEVFRVANALRFQDVRDMGEGLGYYYQQQPIVTNAEQKIERRKERMWKMRNRFRPNRKRNQKKRMERKKGLGVGIVLSDDLIYAIETVDSCCPTVLELIEPIAGRNRTGHLVELYQDEKVRQRFYEISCRDNVINKPCKFLESRHSKQSRCVQQHTLTYALVRPPGSANLEYQQQPWSFDYISVRNGCVCEISQARRRRKYTPQPLYY